MNLDGEVPPLLLGIARDWLAWIMGEVGVSTIGKDAYTEECSVSNEPVYVNSLTTHTDTCADSVEGETVVLAVGETIGSVARFADLELWARIRYSNVRIETILTTD